MGRTSGIEPPREPLADGVVLIRLRRGEDLDTIAEASRDPETIRWLQDRPHEKCNFTRIGARQDDNGNTKLVFARTPPRG